MLDVGSNVGAMALSVLLRNPNIQATCYEPNARALECLSRSRELNGLRARLHLHRAVVSDRDGEISFDTTGSVTGHVNSDCTLVPCVSFARVVNEVSATARCLIKIDIEG